MMWSYESAFKRNIGLISSDEQKIIRTKRVAIPGMGGVGGVHLITLLRMGFEKFSIADFDKFEIHNFNRQYGAELGSIGNCKVQWMKSKALNINPEADLRVFTSAVSQDNIDHFLEGVDILIDGVDAFEVRAKRALFYEAYKRHIPIITAAPLGFSTSWLVFSPNGMSPDEYFGFHDKMTDVDLLASFLCGVGGAGTHLKYMDLDHVNINDGSGPSSSLACELSAGVTAAEVLKLVLHRPNIKAAPHYQQFDAYLGVFKTGYRFLGGRNPLFLLKKAILRKMIQHRLDSTLPPKTRV